MQQYLLYDFDPTGDATLEEWAQDRAEQGWRTWAGSGAWTTINGRRLFRIPLVREAHHLKAELATQSAAAAKG